MLISTTKILILLIYRSCCLVFGCLWFSKLLVSVCSTQRTKCTWFRDSLSLCFYCMLFILSLLLSLSEWTNELLNPIHLAHRPFFPFVYFPRSYNVCVCISFILSSISHRCCTYDSVHVCMCVLHLDRN